MEISFFGKGLNYKFKFFSSYKIYSDSLFHLGCILGGHAFWGIGPFLINFWMYACVELLVVSPYYSFNIFEACSNVLFPLPDISNSMSSTVVLEIYQLIDFTKTSFFLFVSLMVFIVFLFSIFKSVLFILPLFMFTFSFSSFLMWKFVVISSF